MEGLRSDCWGAMTALIFRENLFLEVGTEKADCAVEKKEDRPTSFWVLRKGVVELEERAAEAIDLSLRYAARIGGKRV